MNRYRNQRQTFRDNLHNSIKTRNFFGYFLTNWSEVEPEVEEEVPAEEDGHWVPQPLEEPQQKLPEGHPVVLGVVSVELRVVEEDAGGDVLLHQSKQKDGKGSVAQVKQLEQNSIKKKQYPL